ncbi:hypothetical protein ACM01_45090 [Streptomyces viridochromogenes]|uniref:Secreted protein n=1 Tax=Streptomyces viridochromogenes TaxID=1938 RepID=A0A0J7YSX8_STRVR|nr:hypothetical protein [Streptomyces viridochromogenes]KMS66786.1 hypothetical protein ACM01_45090 [Streptomyces viridochromogenes]KOG24728.1 hypothetical protein ADK35_10630 [Streptomyces viridochromogenes]KOG24869.1 hypothetical protein ADK36_07220 [Streptomyces viridochromogenes]
MRKRITTALGAAAAAVMLATATASADTNGRPDTGVKFFDGSGKFTRPCGTTYQVGLQTTKVVAVKRLDGRCAGHVWLRVHGNAWGEWRHSDTEITLNSPSGTFDRAQIKGCGEDYCKTYDVYV